jgi:hypothetical protein
VAGLLDQIAGLADTPQKRAALAALVGELERNPAHPPERFNRGVRNVAGGMAKAIGEGIAFPRKYMETYQPGSMAADNPAATEWAAGTAMNMVGAPALTGGVPGMGAGIRAYHGSPHDFDRFDMSKIGTGEGAQAYGHGLYFAENPKVAREYRDKFQKGPDGTVRGVPVAKLPSSEFLAAENLREHINRGLPFAEAKETLLKELADAKLSGVAGSAGFGDVINALKNIGPGDVNFPRARMYEVNINAAPEQFLDFDAPLTRQPSPVQEIFPQISKPHDYTVRPNQSGKSWSVFHPGGWIPNGAQNFYKSEAAAMAAADAMNAKRTIQDLVPRNLDQVNTMREAGIPGIKYLDQGSRGSGEGTSNYVLFRDDIIEILKKYGIAGLSALPALQNAPQLEQAQ